MIEEYIAMICLFLYLCCFIYLFRFWGTYLNLYLSFGSVYQFCSIGLAVTGLTCLSVWDLWFAQPFRCDAGDLWFWLWICLFEIRHLDGRLMVAFLLCCDFDFASMNFFSFLVRLRWRRDLLWWIRGKRSLKPRSQIFHPRFFGRNRLLGWIHRQFCFHLFWSYWFCCSLMTVFLHYKSYFSFDIFCYLLSWEFDLLRCSYRAWHILNFFYDLIFLFDVSFQSRWNQVLVSPDSVFIYQ